MGQRRKKVRSRRGQSCRKKRLLHGKCRVPNEHGSTGWECDRMPSAKWNAVSTKTPSRYFPRYFYPQETWKNLNNISKTIINEHGSNRLGMWQNAKCQRVKVLLKRRDTNEATPYLLLGRNVRLYSLFQFINVVLCLSSKTCSHHIHVLYS
jgi:hypothetical protein